MKKAGILALLLVGLTVVGIRPGHAVTYLQGDLTADNGFSLYISQNDSALGTFITSGGDWTQTFSFQAALASGVTNYLHIIASDWGGPEGLIGDFTLSNSLFQFANGAQHITTNTTDWSIYYDGFGVNPSPAVFYGTNGVYPWYTRPNIDAAAQWIWGPLNTPSDYNTKYFSLTLTPTTPVPEPATLLLIGSGLIGVAVAGTRRKQG